MKMMVTKLKLKFILKSTQRMILTVFFKVLGKNTLLYDQATPLPF